MAYTICISLSLGSSKTGLTLNAQLLDVDLNLVGSAVSSGFSEVGNGNYLWNYSGFPDGFRGGVKFYSQGSANNVLSLVSINPEEVENVDVKVSSTGSGSSNQIEINVGHSNINVENSTTTPVGNETNIEIITKSQSLSPQINLSEEKEVKPSESVNITPGVRFLGSQIQITPGVRG